MDSTGSANNNMDSFVQEAHALPHTGTTNASMGNNFEEVAESVHNFLDLLQDTNIWKQRGNFSHIIFRQ